MDFCAHLVATVAVRAAWVVGKTLSFICQALSQQRRICSTPLCRQRHFVFHIRILFACGNRLWTMCSFCQLERITAMSAHVFFGTERLVLNKSSLLIKMWQRVRECTTKKQWWKQDPFMKRTSLAFTCHLILRNRFDFLGKNSRHKSRTTNLGCASTCLVLSVRPRILPMCTWLTRESI